MCLKPRVPLERVACVHEPVHGDEPSDLEDRDPVADEPRGGFQAPLEPIERRRESPVGLLCLVGGDAVVGESGPPGDLLVSLGVGRPGAREARQRLGRLRGEPAGYDEPHRDRAQVHVEIVLELQRLLHEETLAIVAWEIRLGRRGQRVEVLEDVVALDVHDAVVDQHRHHAARVDAEKPRLRILLPDEIDGM